MRGSSVIRMMVVDDQPSVRSAMMAFLLTYDDFLIVGAATNGLEALQMCEYSTPDVILMDLLMPGMDGAAATRAIRKRYPHVQVIILTGFKETHLIQDALQAGAVDYWLKGNTGDELADAIRLAYHRQPTLTREVVQALDYHLSRPQALPVREISYQ
ncbi:MAG: response regulator transcription factor [Caldilineaceae bacterium]